MIQMKIFPFKKVYKSFYYTQLGRVEFVWHIFPHRYKQVQQHSRTVGSSENPRGLNLTPHLTFLPKSSGKGEITHASLVPTALHGNVFTILCVQLFYYLELYHDKLKVFWSFFQVTLSKIVSLFQNSFCQ